MPVYLLLGCVTLEKGFLRQIQQAIYENLSLMFWFEDLKDTCISFQFVGSQTALGITYVIRKKKEICLL